MLSKGASAQKVNTTKIPQISTFFPLHNTPLLSLIKTRMFDMEPQPPAKYLWQQNKDIMGDAKGRGNTAEGQTFASQVSYYPQLASIPEAPRKYELTDGGAPSVRSRP